MGIKSKSIWMEATPCS